MAGTQVGSTATIARAGRRKTGARVFKSLEGSSQTFPIGALLARVAGSGIVMGSTAELQSTGLVGLAINSGQNLSANSLKNAKYFAFEVDQPIKLTFAVSSWTGTAHRGIAGALYMDTNGSVWVSSGGTSTCGTILDSVDWDNGVPTQDGDVNPVVYFVVAAAAISQ
jgi:hypothetical protein